MATGLGALGGAGAGKPNVMFILTDDMGVNFPGYQNPDVITPALDKVLVLVLCCCCCC
jgi:hypothetical protein